MKKIFTIVGVILVTASVFAQVPEKISYQSVIRNSNDQLATNQSVGMQISILQASATGTAVYVERHFPTTNINGLVSLEIGTGTVVSGDFTTIDWASDIYFIKTETDLNGGASYTISGTNQLLSTPYALHAKTAGSIVGGGPSGISFNKLHASDELNLVMSSSIGPNVEGSSTDIGDIANYKGLMLEWRMNGRPEVFHQFIYLSDYDKDIILGNISTPTDYPRRYTTILSDGFGTMMWLGVSIKGTRLYLSTNSQADPRVKLQRIFSFD